MSILERIMARVKKGMQKSLFDLHPEIEDRIPILRVYSDQAASGASTYEEFYSSNTWVHKAIKTLADNFAPLQPRVVRGEGNESEPVENHDLQKLLDYPNDTLDRAEMWREWMISMMLGGEHGQELTKSASGKVFLEMWPRWPNTILIVPGSGGWRYRRVAQYKIDDNNGEPYPVPPEQLLFYKFFNPANPWRGLAPITAIRMGIIIDELAQAWTRLFFRNSARPDFAIIAPEGITPTEKKDILLSLDQQVGGGEGLHRPVVLEQGITDIKPFSFPPKDIEWLEQRKFVREAIGAIFSVPDEIMGWGRDTYENFTAAARVLWTLGLIPLVGLRDNALTHHFRRVKALQPDERVQTDLSGISELQEDKGKKVEQLVKLAEKGYPVNVVNEWLGLGLPAVEGGDTGWLPFGMSPVTSLGSGKRGPKAWRGAGMAKGIAEYGSPEHEALWKARQGRITSHVQEMQRVLKREFQRQQNEVARRLRDSKNFGRGQFAARKASIPPVEELFDYDEEVKLFIKALKAAIKTAIAAMGQAAIEDVLDGGLFDVSNPLVQEGIELVLRTVAEKVNDTTWTNLIELFQEAEAAGEGIPKIMERLSAYFGDRKSDWQTERIARTTMTGATNFADHEAWKQSGVVEGSYWISALLPNRTRDTHAEAHFQFATLEEPFTVGGESLFYPGDPAGSAGNVINCLCSSVPKGKE